jgi:hypothetical protein
MKLSYLSNLKKSTLKVVFPGCLEKKNHWFVLIIAKETRTISEVKNID